jgi:hypothetical protein
MPGRPEDLLPGPFEQGVVDGDRECRIGREQPGYDQIGQGQAERVTRPAGVGEQSVRASDHQRRHNEQDDFGAEGETLQQPLREPGGQLGHAERPGGQDAHPRKIGEYARWRQSTVDCCVLSAPASGTPGGGRTGRPPHRISESQHDGSAQVDAGPVAGKHRDDQ